VQGWRKAEGRRALAAPILANPDRFGPQTGCSVSSTGKVRSVQTPSPAARMSNTHTNAVQEPAPIVNGWSALVAYNPASPQPNLPAELRTILNARANPNAPFTIYQMLPFNRESSADVYSYNMTAGIRGVIPTLDWTYEVFGSQGKTQSTVTQAGFGSLQRYRALINYGNFGQGFAATGNAEGGGFGASTATCTIGLNPFGGAISNDCLEAVKADIKTRSTMHQTVWEGDAQGKLFDLPAGELRAALGASYRSNNCKFENDTLTTQGRSFLEQSIGLYPSGNSSGKINVSESYGDYSSRSSATFPLFRSSTRRLAAACRTITRPG
jgi:iron complex outermembrane receptor protein